MKEINSVDTKVAATEASVKSVVKKCKFEVGQTYGSTGNETMKVTHRTAKRLKYRLAGSKVESLSLIRLTADGVEYTTDYRADEVLNRSLFYMLDNLKELYEPVLDLDAYAHECKKEELDQLLDNMHMAISKVRVYLEKAIRGEVEGWR